ncbi:MAG: DUF499 domain-containing protein [Solirubrobacteraceae bacterium]
MSPGAAYALRPWTDVVRPHADVRSGDLALGTYAANLAQVAMTHEAEPVYGDAESFFAATYFTPTMCGLVADVFGALAGQRGDRVIQLKTPFGGGKTHSLLALFHLARSRAAAAGVPELDGVADPGAVRIAVLSGEYLDPARGREAEGRTIMTLWGELAFQLGGWPAYEKLLVDGGEGPPPAGERLGRLLAGSPALILLDEVLVYAAKAKSLRVGNSTLDRQVLLFVQHLTEAVNQQRQAALVYSLQASVGEAVGEEGLLEALEKIAGRIDERREPVSGDEVLRVVQRRLFADTGDEAVRSEVARAYGDLLAAQLAAGAETDGDRLEATAAGRGLEQRILESYPFHPELLDLMFHRWGSLPTYQRTRGALQFLATVVHALWANRSEREPQPLIGPGDVDLSDEGSRLTFLEQVGATNQYASVVQADFLATDAGTRRIDERLGRDAPGLERARVGTRVATAIMLLSFGARDGAERGALERDVLETSLAPGLDRNVLLGALEALRGEALLFLHHVSGRYRFEPQPNLNRLIQQETANVTRESVQAHVRARLEDVLGARGESRHVVLWPAGSSEIPDETEAFQVVYLPADWSPETASLSRLVLESGSGPRVARNALAFVEPAPSRFDDARAAARRALAVDALLAGGSRIGLSAEQKDELKERLKTSEQELRAALGQAYTRVQVPLGLADDGTVRFTSRDLGTILAGGRALHERVREALQTYVAEELFPSKIAALAELGEDREWRWISEVVRALPRFFDAPKVWTPSALSAGISKAVSQGALGYVGGAEERDGDLVVPSPTAVRLREDVQAGSIGLGDGCVLLRVGLAERLRTPTPVTADPPGSDAPEPRVPAAPGFGPQDPLPVAPGGDATGLALDLTATEDDLFTVSQALTKLRALLGEGGRMRLELKVQGTTAGEPIDRLKARNSVVEPLEENDDVTVDWRWTD